MPCSRKGRGVTVFSIFLEVNTMSLQALKNINRTTPTDAEQPKGFPAMLEQFKGENCPCPAKAHQSGPHGAHCTYRIPNDTQAWRV
jgi:hypothetical protein